MIAERAEIGVITPQTIETRMEQARDYGMRHGFDEGLPLDQTHNGRYHASDAARAIMAGLSVRNIGRQQQGYAALLLSRHFAEYGETREARRYEVAAALHFSHDLDSPEALEITELANNGEHWTINERGRVLHALERSREHLAPRRDNLNERFYDDVLQRYDWAIAHLAAREHNPETESQRQDRVYRTRVPPAPIASRPLQVTVATAMLLP